MENFILNGCSFIAGHSVDYKSTLNYHFSELTGKEPINLGKSGGSNERTFRTIFNYIESKRPTNHCIVLGLTHWARFEIYDETTNTYFPMNFFSNDFQQDIINIIGNKQYHYIDVEFELAAAEKEEFSNFFNNFSKEDLRKATLLYVTVMRNKRAILDNVLREVKLLKVLCESLNNQLIVFNSLDCLKKPNLDYFIEIPGYNTWLDKITDENRCHPDPNFSFHPDSESNLEMTKYIIKQYEIRNRH